MRAKLIWIVLAVLAAFLAWALMTPPAPAGRVGVNRLVENAVTTTPASRTEWRPSVVGADVNFGDRVATAAASRLEVSLLDRSLLTVGSNAQLEIDRFVYDPERGVLGAAVTVLRGAFRFASNTHGAQPEPIAFRTPGAAIGIRGTVIEGVVGPEAVALLAGIPGAPDLSAESDSAAVIILREGVIGIEVNGQSVILNRPVQMVALTRTKLYPAFGASDEIDRRFQALLPTRDGPSGDPPTPPPAQTTPVPPLAGDPGGPVVRDPPANDPPTRQPPTRDPAPRPPLTRAPATVVATDPGTSAPATAGPTPGGSAIQTTRVPRLPTTSVPQTRLAPTGSSVRQPDQPAPEPPPTRAPRQQ